MSKLSDKMKLVIILEAAFGLGGLIYVVQQVYTYRLFHIVTFTLSMVIMIALLVQLKELKEQGIKF